MGVLVDCFRENVESILAIKRMSRVELSERLGTSKSYVSQVLNGRHDPSMQVVEDFAKALRIRDPRHLLAQRTQHEWSGILTPKSKQSSK